MVNGFPEAMARYVHGTWPFPGQKMRSAWVLAIDNYQPGFKEYNSDQTRKHRGVVMVPSDEDWRSPWDDYFHGHGPAARTSHTRRSRTSVRSSRARAADDGGRRPNATATEDRSAATPGPYGRSAATRWMVRESHSTPTGMESSSTSKVAVWWPPGWSVPTPT